MVRTQRYKWWKDDTGEYLFDIEKDPYEKNNLIQLSEYKQVAEGMRSRLSEFILTTQVNYSANYKGRVKRYREKLNPSFAVRG